MRPLTALLLALALGFAPLGEAVAGPLATSPALLGPVLRSVAHLGPAELAARLRAGHADVDEALGELKERAEASRAAARARDEAAARVEGKKRRDERGEALDQALRAALVLDEKANVARSRQMAAEAEVAKRGAALLRLYDAALTLKRREVERLSERDSRRLKAVRTYQGLARQRDEVRRSLGPVLGRPDVVELDAPASVRASAGDDVESLLEKADLARDLEERFSRRAEAVSRRIRELAEERAVARDVAGLVRSQSLFDEDDMRLRVVSAEVRAQQQPVAPFAGQPARSTTGGFSSPTPGPPALAGGNERAESDGDVPSGAAGVDAAPPPAAPSDDFGAQEVAGGTDPAASAPAAPDVSGTALSRSAERAFLASPNDVDLAALLASGELTLPELKALEDRLRRRAKEMRAQAEELRGEARSRERR